MTTCPTCHRPVPSKGQPVPNHNTTDFCLREGNPYCQAAQVGYLIGVKAEQDRILSLHPLECRLEQLGASHLRRHSDPSPSPSPSVHSSLVTSSIAETLVSAEHSRLLTALAPVVVKQIEYVRFPIVLDRLVDLGLSHRLGWLIDNINEAIRVDLSPTETTARAYRRYLVLSTLQVHPSSHPIDVIDRHIRSAQTLAEVQLNSSAISRKWGVVTDIQPADFAEALRKSYAT